MKKLISVLTAFSITAFIGGIIGYFLEKKAIKDLEEQNKKNAESINRYFRNDEKIRDGFKELEDAIKMMETDIEEKNINNRILH